MLYGTHVESPLGDIFIVSDKNNIIRLVINPEKGSQQTLNEEIIEDPDMPVLISGKKWIDDYFSLKRPDIKDLPLAPIGGEFRQIVWNIVMDIPYGETMTYGEIAKEAAKYMGKSIMSAQAVGGAVGSNPIPIIIPCHRVMGANGNLTGYYYGLDTKIRLLQHEGVDISGFHIPKKKAFHKKEKMELSFIPITEDFYDLKKVDDLAKEAFPPIEYPGTQKVIEMSQKYNADFLSIYDESLFVGFITVLTYKKLAYLYFLAVRKELRSKGYGSAILNMLKDIYPGYTQVVDLEKQESSAENSEQRKKRLAFYMRNGYKRTGFFAKYCGMDLEILCASEQLDTDLVKGALENAGLDNFYPEYYYQQI